MISTSEVRKSFPLLEKKIQLSSCSQSALHIGVKKEIQNYMDSWEYEGMDWEYWMGVCEEARAKFAKLINAEPHEISIVSSVSHAISSILTSLSPVGNKKDILLSTNDFPCIGHVALSQNELNVIHTEPEIENYKSLICKNTLLTSVPHVSYYNGEIFDLNEVSTLTKTNNSYLFVDAYQSAGQIDIDVKSLDIDFLTAGMQKYLLGIPGIAFLYVKKDIAEKLTPRVTGWFGQKNPFLFDGRNVEYANGAIRFDTGTFPMINGFAANKALDIILKTGVSNIQTYLRELSEFAINYSLSKDLEVASPLDVQKKGSNTAIKIVNASLMEKELRKEGILVSARNDVIRIAPHFYNTKEDIKKAIDTILKFKKAL